MSNQPTHNAWITTPRPNPQATHRLFCFSYAGGGTSFFSRWVDSLPHHLELCPIRLPGRESRLAETPYTSVSAIIPPLAQALRPFLTEKSFSFFGHSLGGFIAFELARHLRQHNAPQPQKLLISGTRAPHLLDDEDPIYHLPHDDFIAALRRLNGTPEAVLQNQELLALVLPCLRADFKASETYAYIPAPPLAMPIVTFGGTADPKATPTQLQAWAQHTTATTQHHLLHGDHFFIHSQKDALLQHLSKLV